MGKFSLKRKYYTILFFLLILLLQFALRIPFLSAPLDFDEGIYSYFSRRIAQGEILYRDFIDNKPPGIFYIYMMVYKLFGENVLSIRLFSLFLGMFTTFLVFLIGRRLLDERFGLVSAFLYALFSGGALVEGTGANTEIFMIVPMVLGFYCFLRARESPSFLLWAGLFSGLAVMIKQVAAFNFLVLMGFMIINKIPNPKSQILAKNKLLNNKNRFLGFGILIFGFSIFPLLFTFYFWLKGALPDFINSIFFYSIGLINLNMGFFLIKTAYIMLFENSILWVLALVGGIYILLKSKDSFLRLLLLWAFFSLVGVFSAGFSFGHYYVQVIPGLCLLGGLALVKWKDMKFSKPVNAFLWIILAILAIFIVISQCEFYLTYIPERYGETHVAARDIGLKIGQRTEEKDFLFTNGLYLSLFYAKRNSLNRYYIPVGGGEAEVYLFGEKRYTHNFRIRRSAELLKRIEKDYNSALDDRRTKYFIYLRGCYVPADIGPRLKRNGYVLDRELSNFENEVFVYMREK